MNRCHPYAQCIYVTSTADYECRCNPGYEGDGMECIKTGTFHPHLRHLLLIPVIPLIIEYGGSYARRNARIHYSRVVLNAEVSCLEVDICDPNASCQQEESLAKCVCNPGFEGDGTTCSPIGHISYLSYFFFFLLLLITLSSLIPLPPRPSFRLNYLLASCFSSLPRRFGIRERNHAKHDHFPISRFFETRSFW